MSVHQYKNIYVNGRVINLCLTELKCGCNQNNLDSTARISLHGRISHNTGEVTALGTLGYQNLTSPRTRRFQMLRKRRMLLFPAVVKQSGGKWELQPPLSFALCSLKGGKWRTQVWHRHAQVTRESRLTKQGTLRRVLNLTCGSVLVSLCQEMRKEKQ